MKPAKNASIKWNVLYVNNAPYKVELQILLSFHDLYRMKDKKWFQKLCKYLGHPEIQENIAGSFEGLCLKGTEVSYTKYPLNNESSFEVNHMDKAFGRLLSKWKK